MEIRGVVGRADISTFNGARVCKFTVATDFSYRDRENNPVMDTTWFTINIWEGRNVPDVTLIQKGCWVHVIGRIRTVKYVNQEGQERNSWDVAAYRVDVLPWEDEPMQPQRNFQG